MPVKRYGIYLAYAPRVDLRNQGLGRYLASLIRGAQAIAGVEFIIACPSWSRDALQDLFVSEGLSKRVTVISPPGKPYLLRIYEAYRAFQRRPRRRVRLSDRLRANLRKHRNRLERCLAQTHDLNGIVRLLAVGTYSAAVGLISLPPLLAAAVLAKSSRALKGKATALIQRIRVPLNRWVESPKDDPWTLRLFHSMHETESLRLKSLVESRDDVIAWCSPTAFWPAFNALRVPTLMCVPDVVLTDFSIGFATVGGDRFLDTFEAVGSAIRGARHRVTYSDDVKWGTLVDRYGVPSATVSVIRHAPHTLDHLLEINGFPDPSSTSRNYCRGQLLDALRKGLPRDYTAGMCNPDIRFLFYPSQIRPNKNMLTLLRAYRYLLRERHLGLKLVLTGDPSTAEHLSDYLKAEHLEHDVIALPGLTPTELAACYRLAELTVNPSLSEGGCPFTFSESVSVGTPVVMSSIPVTLEVLTDPALRQATLFDPYDWRDMAARIEWALDNRAHLLSLQRQTHDVLRQRTWADVTHEYIQLLDAIAADYCPLTACSKGHANAPHTLA